jgi:hypothetical protein
MIATIITDTMQVCSALKRSPRWVAGKEPEKERKGTVKAQLHVWLAENVGFPRKARASWERSRRSIAPVCHRPLSPMERGPLERSG